MPYNKKRLLFWKLISIGAFNKVDYIPTLEFLGKGFYETNPLMADMIETYNFSLVKLILIPLILLALW